MHEEGISRRIILATTMWTISADSTIHDDEGEEREREFMDSYWKRMIDKGSQALRFMNTAQSAQGMLNEILCPNSDIGVKELVGGGDHEPEQRESPAGRVRADMTENVRRKHTGSRMIPRLSLKDSLSRRKQRLGS
jgi:hypothetical protein